jgi:hypothetical protein
VATRTGSRPAGGAGAVELRAGEGGGGERRTWRPGALLRPQRHRGVYDYTFMSVWGVRGTGAQCRD